MDWWLDGRFQLPNCINCERDCQFGQERRLRIAQISQENFMELIGHLPTEEAFACKHQWEMWFQHASTSFKIIVSHCYH